MGPVLFHLTLGLYFLAALAACAAMLGRPRLWKRVVPSLTGGACGLHLAGLVVRGLEAGRCPLNTLPEVVSLLSLAGLLIFLVGFYRRGLQVLAVVLLPLVVVLALASNLVPAAALPASGPGPDHLLRTHVAVSTLGVAALFLTLAGSLLYLWQERALKHKGGAVVLRLRLPALETCDSLVYGSLVLGFLLMTAGVVTGALWRASTPSRAFWLWDQRETLALAAWAIFGALITARLVAGWRGRKAAYLVVLGVAAVLLRMLGVTL